MHRSIETTRRRGSALGRLLAAGVPMGLLALVAAGLVGCGSGPSASAEGGEAFSTGLNALGEAGTTLEEVDGAEGPTRDEIAERIAQSSAGLDQWLRGEHSGRPGDRGPVQTGVPPLVRRMGESDAEEGSLAPTEETPTTADAAPAPADTPVTEPISPEQRIERNIGELRALLATTGRGRGGGEDPAKVVGSALALAALEGVHPALPIPGAGSDQEPTDFGAAFGGALSPSEVGALEAVRALAADLARASSTCGTLNAADVARAARDLLATAESAGGVAFTAADTQLCTRVQGFGRYVALPRDPGFLAGQVNPFLVYTEVGGFTSREVGTGGGGGEQTTETGGGPLRIVEVAQTIELYHDADGVLAWKQGRRVTRQESRRRIRDLFITNRVDLPRRLTVGAYQLKVITEDVATGAVVEVSMPLRIVADPGLAAAAR